MSHERYTIHPTQDHIVMTPDGGVIECKHSAAAQRVCVELNDRDMLLDLAMHYVGMGRLYSAMHKVCRSDWQE